MGGDEFYVCYAYWAIFGTWYYINDFSACDTSVWLATDILDCVPGGGQGN
jgi:hypothetical protein